MVRGHKMYDEYILYTYPPLTNETLLSLNLFAHSTLASFILCEFCMKIVRTKINLENC